MKRTLDEEFARLALRVGELAAKVDASYTAQYVDALESRVKALEVKLTEVLDDNKRFTCPKCGSGHWGTSGEEGRCHGVGCKFSWNRETQDEEVGL